MEKAFVLFLIADVLSYVRAPHAAVSVLISLGFYVTGIIVLGRWAARLVRMMTWRLRNRLIVAYAFIALVPIALILAMVAVSAWLLTGQIGAYMVESELERRMVSLYQDAKTVLATEPTERETTIRQLDEYLSARFPQVHTVISGKHPLRYPADSTVPDAVPGWKDTKGLVITEDGRIFVWAHAIGKGEEITIAAPVSREFLSQIVPGIGDVFLLNFTLSIPSPKKQPPAETTSAPQVARMPPKTNTFDVQVDWPFPIQVGYWNRPGSSATALLIVYTRPSAILHQVFGESVDYGTGTYRLFLVLAVLLFIVELVSLIVGVRITRSITAAVHELYVGTQKVNEGDFSHRIGVRGTDQLAELSSSFNNMTANLERLIAVEKEKERLQSELEIAREVQNQLFPQKTPEMRTLQVTGLCNPARMVSGDYYDYLCVRESLIAVAIGDVAGKGISAALLMAAIQSIMRAQLSAGMPTAMTAPGAQANGHAISTAHIVSLLNRQLYANTSPEKYATFCFALYDETTSQLTYTNAGHLPPILIRNGNPEMLEVTGTVVGALPMARYEEKQIVLQPGDLLVGYTDGITEPENAYGEMFGEERLRDLLVKYADAGSDEIIRRAMEAVEQWTGAMAELQDDMTMLVVRRI